MPDLGNSIGVDRLGWFDRTAEGEPHRWYPDRTVDAWPMACQSSSSHAVDHRKRRSGSARSGTGRALPLAGLVCARSAVLARYVGRDSRAPRTDSRGLCRQSGHGPDSPGGRTGPSLTPFILRQPNPNEARCRLASKNLPGQLQTGRSAAISTWTQCRPCRSRNPRFTLCLGTKCPGWRQRIAVRTGRRSS